MPTPGIYFKMLPHHPSSWEMKKNGKVLEITEGSDKNMGIITLVSLLLWLKTSNNASVNKRSQLYS